STDASDVLNDDTNDGGGSTSAISGTDTTWTGSSIILSNIPGGTYTLALTSTLTGCSDTFEFDISDATVTPTFTDSDAEIVEGDQTNCGNGTANYPDGSITVDETELNNNGGSGNYSYRYYFGGLVDAAKLIDDNDDIFTQKSTTGDGPAQNVSGSSTNTVTGLDEGTYTVVVIDTDYGCLSAAEVITINFTPTTPPVQVASTTDNSVCDFSFTNDYNGSIILETTDASVLADYTYTWYQGQSTDAANQINTNQVTTADIATSGELSEIPSGTYTVVITDPISGCSKTIEQSIDNDFTDAPLIVGNASDVDVCTGNAAYPNGSITLTSVTGGSGNYSYTWYFGSTDNAAKKLDDTDDIFTQKSIAGSASVNVSGSTTVAINGLNAGVYAVKVTDTDRGCSTIKSFTVDEAPITLTVTATVDQDNFSCDAANSIGAVSAVGANATGAETYQWFLGTSAVGTPLATGASVTDLQHGTYTVKYTDGATNCFVTDQVIIEEYEPTINLTTNTNSDQTDCTPNGQVEVTAASITFDPAGPPSGFNGDGVLGGTGTYDIQWYYGVGTTIMMSENTDPGNGSNPTGTTSTTMSGLAAGSYTVIVTETQSGCVSASQTVNVGDNISANAPDLEFLVTSLPSECAGQGTFQVRMATNPSGHTFAFEFYEGAQDFANLNVFGDGLATNDELVSNPGLPITVTNNNSSAIGGAANFADNELEDVISGVYTVVVTDQTTQCRYQETYNLDYAGQQTTTTITVENVDECPDNGIARVGLADNVRVNVSSRTGTFDDKESFTTNGGASGEINVGGSTAQIQVTVFTGSLNNGDIITGSTSTAFATIDSFIDGYQDGDFDDISEYVLYLYAGTGIPADRTAAYSYESARFPITYNAANGEIRDGDGVLLRTEGILNLDDEAVFTNLPAGPYIAVAREKTFPAWSPGTAHQCWSEASLDEQILDLAYDPIIDDYTITANTNCDISGVGGNGQLSVTVVEDPNENTNPAINQQPAGYRFTWLRDSDSFQVLQEEIFTETATSTTPINLIPGDYTVTIKRALETLDVDYTLNVAFNEGERITFSGGANGVIISDDGNTMNIYVTNGAVGNGETITGVTSGGDGVVTANVPGATYLNGCSVVETYTIGNNPEQHYITNATVVDYNNCDADPASTITINDNDIELASVGQTAASYTYQWFKGDLSTEITSEVGVGTGPSIDMSAAVTANAALAPIADTYYVVATRTGNNCETPAFEVVISDNTVDIDVSVSVNTIDNSCLATDDDGNGIVDFTINTPATGTYDFAWYTDSDLLVPVAGTATGKSGSVSGPYTGQLNGVNGNQTYYLEITDTSDPNDACSTVASIFLNEAIDPVDLLTSDYTSQEDHSCASDNGFIEISSVGGVALTSGPANYTFKWYKGSVSVPTEITGSSINANTGEGNRIETLSADTYFIEVTEVATSCTTVTEVEIIIDEIIETPTISLTSSTDNTNCAAAGTGNGTIEVDVLFTGHTPANTDNFDYEWYVGTSANVGDADYLIPTGVNTRSEAITASNGLEFLTADTYTLVVTDNTNPYNQCSSTAEFVIADDLPVIEIRQSDIAFTDDN
ncbi:MAG: hypothetical protein ABJZ70_07350, partial [Cyclobacteriaceae bacterium]